MEAAAELVRFGPAVGEPPPPPLGFGHGEYTLPVHCVKSLELRHAHEGDAHIVFHELPHIYVVHGVPMEISVTSLIAPYAEVFDGATAITKMRSSRNEAWPKLKYAIEAEAATLSDVERGGRFLAVCDGKTVFAGSVPPNAGRAAIVTGIGHRLRGKNFTELKFYRYERAMSDDEIYAAWDDNRERAANAGTEAHYQMERFANSMPCRIADVEVQNGMRFLAGTLAPIGFKVYRTEWEIYSRDEEVAGSIDLVGTAPDPRFADALRTLAGLFQTEGGSVLGALTGYDLRDACVAWEARRRRTTVVDGDEEPHGCTTTCAPLLALLDKVPPLEAHTLDTMDPAHDEAIRAADELSTLRLVVVDWKRATNHDIHSRFRRTLAPPFAHIDDTAVAKFAVQLGVYKYILERRMGFRVMALALAGVHPDSPFHTFVPYLRTEVEYLMGRRRARVAAKTTMRATGVEAPRCSASGDYAWIAVRGPDGALYHRPHAALCFPTAKLVPDAEAQRAVDAHMPHPSDEVIDAVTPWSGRMPPLGFPDFVRCEDNDVRVGEKRPRAP